MLAETGGAISGGIGARVCVSPMVGGDGWSHGGGQGDEMMSHVSGGQERFCLRRYRELKGLRLRRFQLPWLLLIWQVER